MKTIICWLFVWIVFFDGLLTQSPTSVKMNGLVSGDKGGKNAPLGLGLGAGSKAGKNEFLKSLEVANAKGNKDGLFGCLKDGKDCKDGKGGSLNLGGLAINDKGLGIDKNKSMEKPFPDLGFTVMPSLKQVLEIHDATMPPGVKPLDKVEKLRSVARKYPSYLEQVEAELEKERPQTNEIINDLPRGEYLRPPDEQSLADGSCPDGDKACEQDMLKWAAAPTNPESEVSTDNSKAAAAPTDPKMMADSKTEVSSVVKKWSKTKRDRMYSKAIQKGTDQGNKDVKKIGGPDPYGGMLLPHLMDKEKHSQNTEAKETREETKGTKTMKGSKKGGKESKKEGNKEPKGKKKTTTTTTTTTTEEPADE